MNTGQILPCKRFETNVGKWMNWDHFRGVSLPLEEDQLCETVVQLWGLSPMHISCHGIWHGRLHYSEKSRWPNSQPENKWRKVWFLIPRAKPFLKVDLNTSRTPILTLVLGTIPKPSFWSTSEAAASER